MLCAWHALPESAAHELRSNLPRHRLGRHAQATAVILGRVRHQIHPFRAPTRELSPPCEERNGPTGGSLRSRAAQRPHETTARPVMLEERALKPGGPEEEAHARAAERGIPRPQASTATEAARGKNKVSECEGELVGHAPPTARTGPRIAQLAWGNCKRSRSPVRNPRMTRTNFVGASRLPTPDYRRSRPFVLASRRIVTNWSPKASAAV